MSIESVMPPISSSVVPFSSCLQSFPASGSFPMSQFSSGGQVLEFQLQPQSFQWIFRTDFLQHWLVGSPCSPRDSQESSLTPQFKSINSLALPPFFIVQLSHPYLTTGKTIALTRWTFVGKVKFLLFNMLSRLVIAFLPRSKHLLISWLQSPSAVILEPPKSSLSLFLLFPHLFAMKCWDQMPWSSFSECLPVIFSLSMDTFFTTSSTGVLISP